MFLIRRTKEGHPYIIMNDKILYIKFDNMGMFIMDNGVSHRIKMDSEGKYYIKSQDDKEFVLTEYDQQILSLRQSKRVNI